MAYASRVYRILIASPSDVEDEREIAVSVIHEWNDLNSYSRNVTLLPLRWETHTAPDYGTRPQEVVNRAIVDDCDLLVGVFWTRIGSSTGVADSGTLEEIERVGKAGKPIMLYFSKVEIDPDRIDADQIEKLRSFKEKTYPKGLVEKYNKTLEFRDKFSRQLELKIRELQQNEAAGKVPLSLEFLSIEDGEPAGKAVTRTFDHPNVDDLEAVPKEQRDRVATYVRAAVRESSSIPLALAIVNSSPFGVRNLYVELDFSAASKNLELNDFISTTLRRSFKYEIMTFSSWGTEVAEAQETVERKLAKFKADKLQRTDQGWRLSFEWDALQPQRTRLIEPVLFVYTPESAELSIQAKVFGDSFPKPFVLTASMKIEARQKSLGLNILLPTWKELLEDEARATTFTMGNVA